MKSDEVGTTLKHSKLNILNSFQDFRIATFPLDSIMYEGKGLELNQAHQPLYVP